MKYVDLKSKTDINFNKENSYKDPKFKVGDYLRISKYENTCSKGYIPDWSEEVFVVIKKVKNTVRWTYFTEDPNGKETIGTFYEEELQKTNQKE